MSKWSPRELSGLSKLEKYDLVRQNFIALADGEPNLFANAANLCALLTEYFNWHWVGFYWVDFQKSEKELVLGVFQGPVACTRIRHGQGVCGQAWAQMESITVEDVNTFEGHIACSTLSKSEIVIPIIKEGQCIGVLDADSENMADFDPMDQQFLEELTQTLIQYSVI